MTNIETSLLFDLMYDTNTNSACINKTENRCDYFNTHLQISSLRSNLTNQLHENCFQCQQDFKKGDADDTENIIRGMEESIGSCKEAIILHNFIHW